MVIASKNKMKEFEVGNMSLALGKYAKKIWEKFEVLEKTDLASRIWRKDATVWIPDRTKADSTPELIDRLGWLETPENMLQEVSTMEELAKEIKEEGFKHVVLLGMGGSSLAPEVFMSSFGPAEGYPALIVLDSTHPKAIKNVLDKINIRRTIFLVSSKSGGTLETDSLFRFFFNAVESETTDVGSRFIAITDPGTSLEKLSKEKKFRGVFASPKDVGGRFSALTYFGLLPAALIGVNIEAVLKKAIIAAEESQRPAPITGNPAIVLGTVLGELAMEGRNKLTLFTSKEIGSFGAWVEQLIAESTGKNNRGIVPIVGEDIEDPSYYGEDRLFIYVHLKGSDDDIDSDLDSLESSGEPVVRIDIEDKEELGGLFFNWEMATAVAGALMGINPFDQPDVEATKIKTKELMKAFEDNGVLPSLKPLLSEKSIDLYSPLKLNGSFLEEALRNFLSLASQGDYLSIMAYLPREPQIEQLLEKMRGSLFKRLKRPTTLGYGPRFLHSTGQLHKGDANKGIFIQITGDAATDLAVPGKGYSFSTLIAAQAEGDYRALCERNRRIIRLHLKGNLAESLAELFKNYFSAAL